MKLINSTQHTLQYKSFTTVEKNSHMLKTFVLNFLNYRIELKPSYCMNRMKLTFVAF